MRTTCVWIVLVMTAFSLAAEEKAPQLSQRAQKAVQAYDRALWVAEQDYLKAVEEAQANLEKDLNREAGRLRLSDDDRAMADRIAESEGEVREALLEVASTKVQQAVLLQEQLTTLSALAVADDLVGNKIRPERHTMNPNKEFIGTWNRHIRGAEQPFDFSEDGTFSRPGAEKTGWHTGKWVLTKEGLTVTFENGHVDRYTLNAEDGSYVHTSANQSFRRP